VLATQSAVLEITLLRIVWVISRADRRTGPIDTESLATAVDHDVEVLGAAEPAWVSPHLLALGVDRPEPPVCDPIPDLLLPMVPVSAQPPETAAIRACE